MTRKEGVGVLERWDCPMPNCTAPNCTALRLPYAELHSTELHSTELHSTELHSADGNDRRQADMLTGCKSNLRPSQFMSNR